LTVEESDGSVVVRPANTIKFNEADFTVAKSGNEATISIDSTGTGAALTATQVGFGNSSNLLTGSTKFTYNDTAGSEQLKLIGTGVSDCGILLENTNTGSTSAPDLVLYRGVTGADNDFIGRMDYRGKNASGSDVTYVMVSGKINDASEDAGRIGWFVSGNASINADDAQLMIFGRTGLTGNPGLVSINNSARSDVDFRVSGDTNANLIRTDASLDAVGIGIAPASSHAGITVRMTVKGDNDDIALMLQNDGTDADDGPEMVFYRNSSSPAANDLLGRIRFDGEDSGGNVHTYFRMTNAILDPTDAGEDGRFLFESRSAGSLIEVMRFEGDDIDINANNVATVDVKIRGDNDTILFSDASQDNLGLGTSSPSSDVERLHIKGTGTGDLVRLESTDAGTTQAPTLELFRNSASPASGDYTGEIVFAGYEDTAGSSKVDFGRIDVRMFGQDASENGVLGFYTRQNNALRPQLSMKQIGCIFNENNEAAFDLQVQTSGQDNTLYVDSGQDNVGIGTVPDSDVERLHVKGTGASATDPLVRLEVAEDGALSGPIIDLYRNSGTPENGDNMGEIFFRGNHAATSGGSSAGSETYGRIRMDSVSVQSSSENSIMLFDVVMGGTLTEFVRLNASAGSGYIVFNEGSKNIDFRVESDGNANMFKVDGGNNLVCVGASGTSGGAQFQVDEDASFLLSVGAYTANHDVTAEQAHGYALQMKTGSGTGTFTLPETAVVGMHLTVINFGAGMNVAVNGSSSHKINGGGSAGNSTTATVTAAGARYDCVYIATDVWNVTAPAVVSAS
jgi:hypothetical protein